MENFEKEYYQQIIRTDTHASQWTQFELDLIRCIKEEYPIIFTKTDNNMTSYQRAGKIKSAWKQIDDKFPELPIIYIKARWRSILDNYLKVKIFASSTSDFQETLVNCKFMDGTLSFLEDGDLLNSNKKTKNSNPDNDSSDNETNDDDKSHEGGFYKEVGLEDYTVTVKKEYGDKEVDTITEAENHPDFDVRKVKDEPKTTWTEDKLLNATRLTKEMIDQLILIKTRSYYMSPVVDK